MDSARKHCYVEALQAAKRASEKKGAGLEQTLRMAQLRWDRRERSLLAQVAALQSEAKLFALAYQQRLQGYLLHISSIAEEIGRYCERDSRTLSDMQSHASNSTSAKLQKAVEGLKRSTEL
ncbi:PREDICTED: E3 ubiquitin-protein ligase PDZRN3-like [Cyprinodon variegatus]|uniref:E3 ubiquitin-protein ligase PDZRN3-like n=1 Tax=Cyprinodon variegatus TaxID=28743 RepID=UPI0007426B8B|nr:PREDICTED: E3 ubiquitin-protein ligase PDZRN3-like [Cyprinodon variegatus]